MQKIYLNNSLEGKQKKKKRREFTTIEVILLHNNTGLREESQSQLHANTFLISGLTAK